MSRHRRGEGQKGSTDSVRESLKGEKEFRIRTAKRHGNPEGRKDPNRRRPKEPSTELMGLRQVEEVPIPQANTSSSKGRQAN